MGQNPFSLSFGREPKALINTTDQFDEVVNSFNSTNPTTTSYLITGVRGSGKTVLLTRLSKHFNNLEDWIVVELNPEIDMLEYLASSIYEQMNSKYKFLKKEFSFSFHGISFSISGEKPVSNVITLLEKMFEIISKQNKKVLICVDDVAKNQNLKVFAQQFQIFIRKDYPLYLLMTGLFENVRELQNEKTLTFLYRALQINVGPLSVVSIADSFENLLKLEHSEAVKAAKLTKGYAFAYQVLGYVLFDKNKKAIDKEVLSEIDKYLREYVYEKIYFDLSKMEKEFVCAMASANDTKIASIMNLMNLKKDGISPYRDKLLKKGIIVSLGRGELDFALPRFKEYILLQREFE